MDSAGEERKAGDRWLVRKIGSYLPGVNEVVFEKRKGHILTDK